MTLILELENPIHWILRDSQTIVFPESSIPEYSSIVTFSSNIIGVLATVEDAPNTWEFGGYMHQKVNLGFGSASPGTAQLNPRKLFLKRKQLFVFPDYLPPYKLSINFPKWFPSAKIMIWEYLGPQIDTVEQKLDTLLQQHPP